MKYNKLVRDKIPDIIRGNSDIPVTHIADDKEYSKKLLEKLQEEVDEYLKDNSVEELADILEVLHALAKTHGISVKELDDIRVKKLKERGGFEDKIILDETK